MKASFLSLAILLASVFSFSYAQERYIITGTYTKGKSEGIYVLKFNESDGSLQEISSIKSSNPSFVAVSADQKFVYAVNENGKDDNGGELSAFSFDKSAGKLTLLNQQLTKGDHPCYVDLDKTGKWAFAGNYSSGTLSVFPIKEDGSLGEATTTIKHSGSGADKQRQEKPHVHCTIISPDNKFLFVPDLGIDKVMIYAFNAKTGKLTPAPQPFVKTKPGAGPRHLTFHPNGKFAYLIEELSGQVIAYSYKNGKLTQVQQTASTARGSKGFAGSADIHVSADGKFLYASNRGDYNNLAYYKINPASGKLSIVGFQSTLGTGPRNFTISPNGQYLIVGNQTSDEIVVFKRNQKTGGLTDEGKRLEIGSPICFKWADLN
jgi:6-phosphogluconolactonase